MQRLIRIDPDVVSALTLGIKGLRVNTLKRRSSDFTADEMKLPNECQRCLVCLSPLLVIRTFLNNWFMRHRAFIDI